MRRARERPVNAPPNLARGGLASRGVCEHLETISDPNDPEMDICLACGELLDRRTTYGDELVVLDGSGQAVTVSHHHHHH